MNLRNLAIAGLAAGVLAFGGAANAQLALDDFIGPTGPALTIAGFETATGAGAGILGGVRVLTVSRVTGAGLVSGDVDVSVAGAFSLSSGAATKGQALLEYDGDATAGINPTGLSATGIDVTAGGVPGLSGLFGSDLDAEFTVTLYDITGATLVSTQTITGTGASSNLQPFVIPFGTFAGAGDITKIGAVSLALAGVAEEADVQVKLLRFDNPPTQVPEPGAVALGAGLLVGAGALIRRRKK